VNSFRVHQGKAHRRWGSPRVRSGTLPGPRGLPASVRSLRRPHALCREGCCWSRTRIGSSSGPPNTAIPCASRDRKGPINSNSSWYGFFGGRCRERRLIVSAGAPRPVFPPSKGHRIPLRWPLVTRNAPSHPPNVEAPRCCHQPADPPGDTLFAQARLESSRHVFGCRAPLAG